MADIFQTIVYFSLFISLYFEVFLLITYIDRRKNLAEESAKPAPTNHPSVSIIVPCYNEENTISKTIHSLLSLNYPKNKLSIIVIDDGSTDNTWKTLARFSKNKQIKLLKKENGGKYTALNLGLQHVDTDLVGCLDADSFVHPEALNRIVPYFDKKDVMAVTPAIKIHEPRSLLQIVQKVEYSWGIFLRKMLSYLGAIYVTPGPFSIFRTAVFKKLGGYKHAHFTEDFEIALRMQSHSMKIANAHDAHVYTVAPRNLKTLYKQRLRWTYGFINNILDYKHMLFNTKFGHLSMYILPMGILSIFTALYFTGALIVNAATRGYERFEEIRIIGLRISPPSFDLFFMDIDTVAIITIVLIIGTLTLLSLGRKMAYGKVGIGRETLYFLFLYGFLAPLWLGKAVWSTLFSGKITWR